MSAALMVSACAAPRVSPVSGRRPPSLVKLSPSETPDIGDGYDPLTLAEAVKNSITYYSKVPPLKKFSFGTDTYTASEMLASLSGFYEFLRSGPSRKLVSRYIREHFDVYASTGLDGSGSVLFTGYYTPEVPAKGEPDEFYKYPVYALPKYAVTAELGLFKEKYRGERLIGMVKEGRFVPFFTREDIEQGALKGGGLEIAWCKDPVDIFFLQVQGSGVLIYPDGTRKNLDYSGTNGRPYRSIGKLLIERGKASVNDMSLKFLQDYLHAHPDEAGEIMGHDESYVFFRLSDAGPTGCLGGPVTPGRSIATDGLVFPAGAPAFIQTEIPVRGANGAINWERYDSLVMNQDTGGAIKGPGRVDIYFGGGEEAELRAGYMRRTGRLYFLAPVAIPAKAGLH
ncbi:MAG: MltA domain-containing protein [Nitrospirota bacterium]